MKIADQVFLNTVQEKEWLGPDEIEYCQVVSEQTGGDKLLVDISIRSGFLTSEQGEAIKRLVSYAEIRREDEEIGREVVRRNLANAQKIAEALRLQKRYYEAKKKIPRLLHILEAKKLLNNRQAFAIQHSFEQEASTSGQYDFVNKNDGSVKLCRKNSRKAPRFTIPNATVNVRSSSIFWISAPGSSWKKTQLGDLSLSGVKVIASFAIKEGSRYRVSIQVPGQKKPIQAKAFAKWVQKKTGVSKDSGRQTIYIAGLEFAELGKGTRAELERLANENLNPGKTVMVKSAS